MVAGWLTIHFPGSSVGLTHQPVVSADRTASTKQGEQPAMTKVAIILGSTRPGRNGEAAARWVYDIASKRDDAEFELVDLADFKLPHLDEAMPPSLGQYAKQHTKDWAAKIATFDGFVF